MEDDTESDVDIKNDEDCLDRLARRCDLFLQNASGAADPAYFDTPSVTTVSTGPAQVASLTSPAASSTPPMPSLTPYIVSLTPTAASSTPPMPSLTPPLSSLTSPPRPLTLQAPCSTSSSFSPLATNLTPPGSAMTPNLTFNPPCMFPLDPIPTNVPRLDSLLDDSDNPDTPDQAMVMSPSFDTSPSLRGRQGGPSSPRRTGRGAAVSLERTSKRGRKRVCRRNHLPAEDDLLAVPSHGRLDTEVLRPNVQEKKKKQELARKESQRYHQQQQQQQRQQQQQQHGQQQRHHEERKGKKQRTLDEAERRAKLQRPPTTLRPPHQLQHQQPHNLQTQRQPLLADAHHQGLRPPPPPLPPPPQQLGYYSVPQQVRGTGWTAIQGNASPGLALPHGKPFLLGSGSEDVEIFPALTSNKPTTYLPVGARAMARSHADLKGSGKLAGLQPVSPSGHQPLGMGSHGHRSCSDLAQDCSDLARASSDLARSLSDLAWCPSDFTLSSSDLARSPSDLALSGPPAATSAGFPCSPLFTRSPADSPAPSSSLGLAGALREPTPFSQVSCVGPGNPAPCPAPWQRAGVGESGASQLPSCTSFAAGVRREDHTEKLFSPSVAPSTVAMPETHRFTGLSLIAPLQPACPIPSAYPQWSFDQTIEVSRPLSPCTVTVSSSRDQSLPESRSMEAPWPYLATGASPPSPVTLSSFQRSMEANQLDSIPSELLERLLSSECLDFVPCQGLDRSVSSDIAGTATESRTSSISSHTGREVQSPSSSPSVRSYQPHVLHAHPLSREAWSHRCVTEGEEGVTQYFDDVICPGRGLPGFPGQQDPSRQLDVLQQQPHYLLQQTRQQQQLQQQQQTHRLQLQQQKAKRREQKTQQSATQTLPQACTPVRTPLCHHDHYHHHESSDQRTQPPPPPQQQQQTAHLHQGRRHRHHRDEVHQRDDDISASYSRRTESETSASSTSSSASEGTAESPVRLYRFLMEILERPDTGEEHPLAWVDRCRGLFRIVNKQAVADEWGKAKNNKSMTYEKFSRSLRYYYKIRVLERVRGHNLVYKFGPEAPSEVMRALGPSALPSSSPQIPPSSSSSSSSSSLSSLSSARLRTGYNVANRVISSSTSPALRPLSASSSSSSSSSLPSSSSSSSPSRVSVASGPSGRVAASTSPLTSAGALCMQPPAARPPRSNTHADVTSRPAHTDVTED